MSPTVILLYYNITSRLTICYQYVLITYKAWQVLFFYVIYYICSQYKNVILDIDKLKNNIINVMSWLILS